MLGIFRLLIKSPMARAYILAGARHVAGWAGTALATWLISKGVHTADATSLAEGVGALVVPATSILYSMLDVKTVDGQVKATQVDTAATVAAAIAKGETTPRAIQAAVQNDHGALAEALAALKAGQA